MFVSSESETGHNLFIVSQVSLFSALFESWFFFHKPRYWTASMEQVAIWPHFPLCENDPYIPVVDNVVIVISLLLYNLSSSVNTFCV